MKQHFTALVAALVLHLAFSILNSAFAAIFTVGIEYPSDAPPADNLIVQCIDTNSALLGQWTVPPTGTPLTNSIAATIFETNATIAISALPTGSANLAIDGVNIASWNGGDVTVAPAMRIGSADAASGLADIDLRLMRKAIGAWRPQAYGPFTNEYAGVTAVVVCTSSPLERSAGTGFVTVNIQGLSVSNLEGAVVSAFVDADGNGRYTAGELFGCSTLYATNPIPGVAATNSAMPWLYATNTYLKAWPEIELSRTHPSMARFDLSPFLLGSATVSVDRSLLPDSTNGWVMAATNSVLSMPPLDSLRLRVVRDAFNGDAEHNTIAAYREVVLDRTFNANLRPILSEADLVAEGMFDLDWGTVFPAYSSSPIGSMSKADLTRVTYRVFVGNGEIVAPDADTSILPIKFINTFERSEFQSPTTPISPAGTIDSGRPTFTWRHDNTIGKDYPAFRLRVWMANGSTMVYDSGVHKAPPRNAQGVYSWTAPLYANMVTDKGIIFTVTNNYKWAVSMLDAKFPSFGPAETKIEFRIETSN